MIVKLAFAPVPYRGHLRWQKDWKAGLKYNFVCKFYFVPPNIIYSYRTDYM